MLKRLLSMTLLLLALSSLLTLSRDGAGDPGGMPPWRQSAEASGRIQLIAGPTTVSPQIKGAVQVALAQAGEALPAADHYAITDLRPAGDWTFVSLVALTGLGGDLNWNLGDASWAGLVLLYQSQDGSWDGALAGTAGFSDLLAKVPDGVLAPAARAGLDPLTRSAAAAEPYIFPWELGTDMLYGISGVHTAGFIAGWKAVDFLSDGNTAVLNAPNRLLAAASGSISYVCRDSVNVAIRIGDLFYVHLIDNSNLTVGHYFDQSEELGQLKTGSFGDYCGWASQSSNWFHVHWGFPDTGTFTAGGWTLDLSDELWRRDGEVKGVGSWFRAEIGDYTVQGRVTDHTYTPISGVTVAAGSRDQRDHRRDRPLHADAAAWDARRFGRSHRVSVLASGADGGAAARCGRAGLCGAGPAGQHHAGPCRRCDVDLQRHPGADHHAGDAGRGGWRDHHAGPHADAARRAPARPGRRLPGMRLSWQPIRPGCCGRSWSLAFP